MRIKEQETCLTLQEHGDDDDDDELFFFSENRAGYEIICKNKIELYRTQTTIWRIESWIRKATNALRICNTYCFSTITMFKRARIMMLRLTYIACLVG